MSEKVKVTSEQADAIEACKREYKRCNQSIDDLINKHEKTYYDNDWITLNDLSVADLAKALYIGYEVEPEYKVGDWVVSNKTEKIAMITHSPSGRERVWVDDIEVKYFTDYRHATPEEIAEEKERRFWNRNGRDVWKLNKYDILRSIDGGYLVEVERVYQDGPLFYEGESVIDLDKVKEEYKVVCFAENRLDVKVND